MIAYVDCLSTEPVVGGGVGAQCWKGGFSEDEDELLPACSKDIQKMLYLQPKSEGSLRRRLLTSKIHQQRDGPWASRPLARGQPDNKGLQGPLHRQDFPYPGPSPPGLVRHHRAGYSSRGSQQHTHGHCLTQLRKTSYSPPTPDHHPGYSFPPPPLSPPGAASYSHTGPSGYPNPGPPGYPNSGLQGYPNRGSAGYPNSNPRHCKPAYNTTPSSSLNPGHYNPAYNTNPSSNLNPGHCNPAYKTNPSSSPNPGHCNPAYNTNPSSNANPGHCNPAYKTNPSSNPNPGHCNPAYNTNPSSNPNPGCQNTAQGHSNTYLNSGYPSPRLGYGPPSLPGPGYSSGFAPQSQPSLPTPPPKQRKRFFNLLRRRSYNTSQIPFSHTPLLHTPKRQDWRAVRLDEDKKWSVHYTSQKPQQETRPSCVDDRRTVLRECSKKLRRVGYGSSQYFSQNPAYLSPSLSENRLHDDMGRNDRHRKKRSKLLDCLSQSCFSVCWRRKSTGSSPDEDLSAYSFRPPPSPPPNSYETIDDTVNGCDITANSCDLTVAEETEWTKPLPLPTPEEKMRQQAQASR
ncbi:tyrosine-protein phosphatase non-receptor type 23-like isoform X1 [Oncorhynchus kisutch]|uniref:tyrosine-protein phosphatase non-receptor type 23-like isoform X1 n=1 Tax=Oncorhynchus kisutch TaxID=8019 RepID=UPI0012DC819F|nr:tyrosine-protein phosphatase non-receptor type 23-like isoform X1 [Oncorhynchus kisutch]